MNKKIFKAAARIYFIDNKKVYYNILHLLNDNDIHIFTQASSPLKIFENINNLSIGKFFTIDSIIEPGSIKTFINDDCDDKLKIYFNKWVF